MKMAGGRPWTQEEIDILIARRAVGTRTARISVEIGRSHEAVDRKCAELEIRLNRGRKAAHVYIIGMRGVERPVKIGITTHPPLNKPGRLQNGNPIELYLVDATEIAIEAAKEIEKLAQWRLRGARIRSGEWFDANSTEATKAICDAIEDFKAGKLVPETYRNIRMDYRRDRAVGMGLRFRLGPRRKIESETSPD